MKSFSTNITDVFDKMQAEEDSKNAKWNKENRPNKEIILSEDGETYTIGLWKADDGSIFYAHRTRNKKIPYSPYSLVKLDSKLVKAIKEL